MSKSANIEYDDVGILNLEALVLLNSLLLHLIVVTREER